MAIYESTPPIVTNGLVLALDAANQKSYISGSTIWNDLSGNGNNAIASGSTLPSYNITTGSASNFYLNGNGYFTIPSNTVNGISNYSTEFSISAFFMYSNTASFGAIFEKQNVNGGAVPRLDLGGYASPSSVYFTFYNSSSLSNSDAVSTISTGSFPIPFNQNQWYQYTTTNTSAGGGTGRIYINGVLIKTYSFLAAFPDNTQTIGIGGYTRKLRGNISNFQIYNRALSATEVLQNYNALKNRFNLG
jgi:hypothetical protein